MCRGNCDFGDDDVTIDACAAPSGYVAVGGDCDDGDDRAFPGQTLYFGIANGEVGYDWNCDGSEDYEISAAAPVRCISSSCPTTRRWVDSFPPCGTEGFVWYCLRTGSVCAGEVEEVDPIPALCH